MDAVRRYDVLDTPPDGAFERITRMAARLFDVPIAIVSIVDTDRIWFKSHHGLDVSEVDRTEGLCASAIVHEGPWVLTDASTDSRSLANPLVAGGMGLRFYAGIPLTTIDGHNLGTLCIIDLEPREVSDDQLATLADLAAMVMDELELRLSAREVVGLEAELRRQAEETVRHLRDSRRRADQLETVQRTLLRHMPDGVMMIGHDGTILACNPAAEALMGVEPGQLTGRAGESFRERVLTSDGSPWGLSETPSLAPLLSGESLRDRVVGVLDPDGNPRWLSVNTAAHVDEKGVVDFVVVSLSDITARHAASLAGAREREASRSRIASILVTGATRMVFQPIVALSTGRVIGVEALARFPGSRRKTPDAWFAEAAGVGLGSDLEVAAVRAALTALPRLPPDTYMSVNVSPESITSSDLLRVLSEVPAGRVVLELTEHRLVPNYEELDQALVAIRSAGVRIAVDDAGAGFAGLQHILNLRPEIIKLDKALTRGIDDDPARRALASSLLRFGSEIGADIVAEGIETKEQLVALRALGVRYGQGHLLGRPAQQVVPSSYTSVGRPGRSTHDRTADVALP